MNLTEFFPVIPGDVFTKQRINLLIAALKERVMKRVKFSAHFNINGIMPTCAGGFLETGFTTVDYCTSNTDASSQEYLDYLIENSSGVEGVVFNFLPYEDMLVNGYSFNQSLEKYAWSIDTKPTTGYSEKNVVFFIKEASLYYIKNGAWERDSGKIIVINSDKVMIRLLNEINGIYINSTLLAVSKVGVGAGPNCLTTFPDILDVLLYFKEDKADALGGLAPLTGTVLPSNISGETDTFSPHLVYTSPLTSSIFALNNAVNYSKLISFSTIERAINENYLFVIKQNVEPAVLANFPFIQSDYFLSQLYTFVARMILYTNNSFQTPKPNYTASLINALYFLVDYLKYGYDNCFGTDGECGCNGVSLSVSDSFSFSTLLVSFVIGGALSNDVLILGSCPAAVGTTLTSSSLVDEPCEFDTGPVSATASVSGPGFIMSPLNFASNSTHASISSSYMVWKHSIASATIVTPPGVSTDTGAMCEVILNLTDFLEIK